MDTTTTAHDWDALQRDLAGQVLLPGAPGYDAARAPAVGRAADIRPLAVVRCAAPQDAAAALAFARRNGLHHVARSGGHCFAGRSSTTGVQIDVGPLHRVDVDGDVATIGAGARLAQVYDGLAARGRTLPAGCGPTVGIAGLTLGGGMGILGRSHGTLSDQLLAAQVVLPGGRVVDCDAGHEPDLFWALRGGGHGLGIVTALTFATLPEPPAATSFVLTWPFAAAAAVAAAWQDQAPSAPDPMAASLHVTVPADLATPPSVSVMGAMIAGERDTVAELDALVRRIGTDPASNRLRTSGYRDTKRFMAQGDEPAGHPSSRSEFFARTLPADALAGLLRSFAADRVDGEARELDFMPMGGAFNRVPAADSAFVHRSDRFLLHYSVTVAPDATAAQRGAAARALDGWWAQLHPWGTGRAYQNFPDPRLADEAAAYFGGNRDRLARVRATHDPH